jgi:hypothetical protein
VEVAGCTAMFRLLLSPGGIWHLLLLLLSAEGAGAILGGKVAEGAYVSLGSARADRGRRDVVRLEVTLRRKGTVDLGRSVMHLGRGAALKKKI